ncbi:MAG: PAAR domain-containing protein [Betaproteobacteria bacterium]|nr:PAAR domain-containing protein [Betaproteobacteria bacterium]
MPKRNFIVLGDTHTGGGEVVTASSNMKIKGIRVALVGDKATCKKHKGLREIVEGLEGPGTTFKGRQVAGHNCLLDCGHRLIASQPLVSHQNSKEKVVHPVVEAMQAREEAAKGILTADATPGISADVVLLLTEQKTGAAEDKVYKIQFKVLDGETKEPIRNRYYSLIRDQRPPYSGLTDSDGMTEALESNKPESVEIRVNFQAPAKTFTRDELRSSGDMSDLKKSDFSTKVDLVESTKEAKPKLFEFKISDKAATRQAIIVSLRNAGIQVKSRSDWKAKPSTGNVERDWDFHSIVLHHAGNSYSCSVDGVSQLKEAEKTDLEKFGQFSYHYAIDCNGTIFEGLDIRYKGAHVSNANTGRIGIVFLTDMSEPGEHAKYGPAGEKWESFKDSYLSSKVTEPPSVMVNSGSILIATLIEHFEIATLGGHREVAKATGNANRACPGRYGLEIAQKMRDTYGISAP